MITSFRGIAIASLIGVTSLVTVGCQTVPTAPEAPKVTADAAVANTAFGLEMSEYLDMGDENVVYSPLSISSALAMTHAGARGETADQIASTLNTVQDGEVLHGAYGELTGRFAERDAEGLTLRLANSLWIQGGMSYGIDFLGTLEREYRSEMRQVDFAAEPGAAREVINAWVEERTESLIPELLAEGVISEYTRLVLVNALYFKGEWAAPFAEGATQPGSFETPEGTVEVAMMRQQSQFRHRSTDEQDVIELPYRGDEFSMVLVVPREGSPAEFLGEMSADSLGRLMDGLEPGTVSLSMPRFEVRSPIDLSEVLGRMGMPLAFDPGQADFAHITRDIPLFLSAVVHEATITVDEAGTEAAAATAAVVGIRSAPG